MFYELINLIKAENVEAYKKLAENGMMLAHPVTINKRAVRDDGSGIGYHSTIKLFDTAKDHAHTAHEVARNLTLNPPDAKTVGIAPDKFKDRFGNDVHVLVLSGNDSDRLKEHNAKFSHMGYPASFEYKPHISLDKKTWDGIKASGAKTAHEAGIEFGPAQLKQGHDTVATYRHPVLDHTPVEQHAPIVPIHTEKDHKKLAASEKFESPLAKGQKGDWQKEGYKISHKGSLSDGDLEIHAHDRTGSRVGSAQIDHHQGLGIVSGNTDVSEGHRRKGIASAMYAHAERVTGHRMSPVSDIPSNEKDGNYGHQSKDGKALWSQPNRPFGKSEAPLEKGIHGALMGATLAAGLAVSPTVTNQSTPSHVLPKSSYDHHRMLSAISQVESNNGQNTNHAEIKPGTHAYGKYGLTPDLVKETIRINPDLKKQYAKALALQGDTVNNFVKDNPGLEDKIADKHLARLEHHFGQDPDKISFGWLNGISGTNRAAKEGKNISDHWHVKKVRDALSKQGKNTI